MSISAINNVNSGDKTAMLREKAAEVVSNVFYGTLLKEFRQSCESGMFSGGFAGEAFQQQMDNIYVTEMSRQGNNPIVDSMVRQLTPGGNSSMFQVSQASQQAYSQTLAYDAVATKIDIMNK